MEDFERNILVGKGPGARTMRLAVKPFTLVGATTRSGLLSSPLRDRFGQHFHLDFYEHADLTEIVRRSARLLGVKLDDDGAVELAARARGEPRSGSRRGARYDRRSIRTLPFAGRLHRTHHARPRRDATRVHASRPHPPRHLVVDFKLVRPLILDSARTRRPGPQPRLSPDH